MSEILFTELRQFSSGDGNDVVLALTKYNGLIFISLGNFPSGGVGDIFTHNPITGRFLLNSTFGANNSIYAFAVDPADNTLYGGLGPVDGKLYSYDNDGTWTELADTSEIRINSIAVFNGNIYMATSGGTVHKWDGSSLTISLTSAETGGDEVNSLHVHNDLLFAGTAGTPKIFVFDDSSWSLEDTLSGSGVNGVECFEIYRAELYCGTSAGAAVTSLWKRDESVSPVNWIEIHAFAGGGTIATLQSFFDHLYIGFGDTIQRFDGTNVNEVKSTSTDVGSYFQNASFGDGDDCLYFGSFDPNDKARLFSICPRCSDQLLISGASPFGWNVSDCDITPEICLIEDGCFCEVLLVGNCVKIQIQYNGPGTPGFVIEDSNGDAILSQSFTNITGIIFEIEHCFENLGENKLIIGEPVAGDSTWTELTDQGSSTINESIVLTEEIFCVIIGQRVNRTSDGGTTWSVVATGGSSFLSIAYDRINDIAAALVNNQEVWVSLDFGLTWIQKTNVTTTGVNKIAVAGSVIFVSGGIGTVAKSLDNGSSWTDIDTGSTRNLTAIFALDDQIVWVGSSGSGDELHRTDNGGSSWVAQSPAAGVQAFNDIFFFDANNGIAVRNTGAVQHTSDGGTTWNTGVSGIANNINGIWMQSTTTGYATADSGDMRKTTDGGANWVAEADVFTTEDLEDIDGISNTEGQFIVAVGESGKSESFDALTSFLEIANVPCVEVRTEVDCGLLIKYTNDDNFADFDYTNGLVNQIRIKAHFWRVDNPTEKSIHITSAEEVIPTRQVVKKQIMLETDIMPEYMHEKLSIIFCHAAIEIDGITYVAEEGYEHDPFPKNFRQAKGHVLLTDKTYTKENIF